MAVFIFVLFLKQKKDDEMRISDWISDVCSSDLLRLQDRGAIGHEALMGAQGQLLQMAAQSPVLTSVRPNGLTDNPRYKVDIDHEKAQALSISLAEISQIGRA